MEPYLFMITTSRTPPFFILFTKFNVTGFSQVSKFLRMCNTPRCCENVRLAVLLLITLDRSSRPEVFFGKGVPKICSKLTEEHLWRGGISTKLQSNLIEITLRHGCSPVNLLHIFKTPFTKNTSGWLLLHCI